MGTTTFRRRTVMAILLMVVAALPLAAHQDFRVIGTIVKITDKRLDVKQTKDGDTIFMAFDAEVVKVTRGKEKVAPSELTVGLSVVVDATGDHIYDLSVRDVMIVPALAPKK
jgi:hypothetical protein